MHNYAHSFCFIFFFNFLPIVGQAGLEPASCATAWDVTAVLTLRHTARLPVFPGCHARLHLMCVLVREADDGLKSYKFASAGIFSKDGFNDEPFTFGIGHQFLSVAEDDFVFFSVLYAFYFLLAESR